jgi:TolB-like protein/Tfp pilus assembly protein PilF
MPSAIPEPPRPSETRLHQLRIPARWAVFSAAVLSLLVVSFWLRATTPNRGRPLPAALRASSLAVLPFVNTSPDIADDYLGYGIAAELARSFTAVRGIQVSPSSSAFAPRQVQADPRIAGRRMGVAAVLMGTVRRSADRIRVTARLIDVDEGFDIWSEAYERQASELLDIEREIQGAVAGALRTPLTSDSTSEPLRPTTSVQAYDAYLAGRYELDHPTPGSARRAQAHLTRAVRLDSAFARAHSALAEAHMLRGGVDAVSPVMAIPLAKSAVTRALELDSTLAQAHATLGTIRFVYDRDWNGAEVEFRRALALEPNAAELYPPYARYLLAMGRIDEAHSFIQRAQELSPLSPGLTHQLGWHYLHAREYDRAREALQRALVMDSSAWRVDLDLVLLEHATANYPAAEAHLRRAEILGPQRPEILAAAAQLHAAQGRPETAEELLAQLQASASDRYISPYLIAAAQGSLGQRSAAFASLDRAVKERAELLAYLRIDPRIDSLRTDRRFARLLRQLRLP